MAHLHDLTLKSFHAGLLRKDFSALEIARDFFDYIDLHDKKIHAYLSLLKDEAVKQASEVDVALAKEGELGFLAGAPLAIKDNMLIDGTQTTAASKILENYTAAYDAAVIGKLKAEKAVFLGKTNLDEFAMGSSTENSAYGATINPYDESRVPGGSSGGSAAAVAANMALAALGSDTGGSVRQPAAFCGVVGLKPTYGAVSRHGLIAMASSLDQIGPITKTVEDAAILFQAIRGKDEFDSTSVNNAYEDILEPPELEKIRKLKIGIPKEYFTNDLESGVAEAVEQAIRNFKSLKIEFKEVSLPHTKYALSVYYIIMPAEVSTNLARFDGIRYARLKEAEKAKNLLEIYLEQKSRGFGAESKRRILLGTFVLSAGYYDAYYGKAQRVRRLIKNDFDSAFKEVDVILAPTTPDAAFKLGEKTADPLQMYLSDIFTIPASLTGLPAISIPVKKYSLADRELPVGFQLIGRPFREKDILDLGQFYEKIGS
ncbi:MAG: Glutamyl-tRNA(Gln) amidotransferase subunit A [Candidatus Jorgensenbacteria bacterium GW2011_GWA1_48_11]|uniref:Glutamyl-tRNA(Gln) amidotransferase subunit A n=1 Tax=Candidatus Jorgensenbacteria bacterium GW2011_GWA1_48_11 TaxID=1618660 RepID=A0A0G1XBL4_9BACT|nr:MAG: Glutamyl-tRNA(Gln) amidotransferase subunit A [Candidatus Jorgensenbacteria bacterium GW2011_GWA1_48_11]KKW12181.1 MAG: Glutamyl-tRNA(Gln) amidotransferase subunit A [Candidatus Jorgensenbacteria bacterium GW2011_GWB1_49_9]